MSYRDLRNFTEMMRALGYSRLISMENFRSPNFPLVAEILVWLANRFETDAGVHSSYGTEEDRILLVRSVAHFMAIKANIILNTKRIYQADGYAVKELLKIASLLYSAIEAVLDPRNEAKNAIISHDSMNLSSRIKDLKLSRELASQVTKKGAFVYELLEKEVELKELRNSSVSNQLELSMIENGLQDAVNLTKDNISNTKSLIENVSITESSLDSKIEKRQSELERNQKRLQTLKKVRPGFLEEFERLEVELQGLYQEYVTKTRIVAHLEMQHEETQANQQEQILKKQRETRKMMEEMEQEDARKLMEEELEVDPDEDEMKGIDNVPVQSSQLKNNTQRRLRTATAMRGRIGTGKKRVFGSMTTGDDDSASIESDSDLLVDFDDGDDDDNSDLLPSEQDRQVDQPITSDDDF